MADEPSGDQSVGRRSLARRGQSQKCQDNVPVVEGSDIPDTVSGSPDAEKVCAFESKLEKVAVLAGSSWLKTSVATFLSGRLGTEPWYQPCPKIPSRERLSTNVSSERNVC